jgi:4-amino-4-deoxy-L-arabinose transferase-like glycosyltransferase
LLLLWATLAIWLCLSLNQTQGHLTYVNDDPYIHMAMARNLAEHGVWGVTRYGFTSTSSSPLWTLLLALLFRVFGPAEWLPLALNVLFASGACVLLYSLLRRHGLSPGGQFAAQVGLQLFIPLAALVFCGQEHTLHLLLTVVLAHVLARVLTAEPGRWYGSAAGLALAPLLVMTRYEGLFLILAAAVLFAVRRRARAGLALAVAALLPVVAYGLVSVAKGWFFLPNPVLLKGNAPYFGSLAGVARFLGWGWLMLAQKSHLLVLLLGASALLWYRAGRTRFEQNSLLLLFIGSALLHAQFARTAPFSRYEGYLVGFGVFAIAATAGRMLSESAGRTRTSALQRAAAFLVAALAATPLAASGFFSMADLPTGSRNIYEQQFQVARFVREFYQGQAVAVNDIGAVNYFADIRCLDLWGLADIEMGRAIARRRHTSSVVAATAQARGASIAVIYDRWFEKHVAGGVPNGWVKAGDWTIRGNVVCGDPTVSFYATDSGASDALVRNLRAFSTRLPPDVIQSGFYAAAP